MKSDRDILHPLEPEVHLVDHVPHEVGEDLSVLGGLQLLDSLQTNKQKFRQIADHHSEKGFAKRDSLNIRIAKISCL
jgi:hypothetical protein